MQIHLTKKTPFFILLLSIVFIQNISSQKAPKPNIVLINIDDLGWKDLEFMGSTYYETPNINKLAKEGMIYTNAYAGAANCAPSRACLISGKNTTHHGVYTVASSERGKTKTRKIIPIKNTLHLSNSIKTLPKMLKSAGYITANFGKWHVGKDPKKQGIDFNVGGGEKGSPGRGGYFSPYTVANLKNGPKGEYLTDRIANEVTQHINKVKDTTFFIYVPFYSVHTPIMGKEELVKKFKNKKASIEHKNPEYAAMIASMDENVGKILTSLKKHNLEKNTIVILTSDNGGINSISDQAPLRAGKGSYYEGGIRVPFIVKWLGKIKENSKSNQVVSNLDIYPTLQNIALPKIKTPSLDGIDIQPSFKNKKTKRDLFFHFPIYLQAYKVGHDEGRDPLFRTRPGSVIISGNWKLHHYFEDNKIELYNLKKDLGEKNNLALKLPKRTKKLYEKLEAWRLQNKAPIPIEKNPFYKSANAY